MSEQSLNRGSLGTHFEMCVSIGEGMPHACSGGAAPYRGISPIRNRTPLGPNRRPMRRALWWSWGGGQFLMSEVPLYGRAKSVPQLWFARDSFREACFNWKVDKRPLGKENSNSYGARPVHQIIPMIEWIRTSRSSLTAASSLSRGMSSPSCSGVGA